MSKQVSDHATVLDPNRRLVRRTVTVSTDYDCPGDVAPPAPEEALAAEAPVAAAAPREAAEPPFEGCRCVSTRTRIDEHEVGLTDRDDGLNDEEDVDDDDDQDEEFEGEDDDA